VIKCNQSGPSKKNTQKHSKENLDNTDNQQVSWRCSLQMQIYLLTFSYTCHNMSLHIIIYSKLLMITFFLGTKTDFSRHRNVYLFSDFVRCSAYVAVVCRFYIKFCTTLNSRIIWRSDPLKRRSRITISFAHHRFTSNKACPFRIQSDIWHWIYTYIWKGRNKQDQWQPAAMIQGGLRLWGESYKPCSVWWLKPATFALQNAQCTKTQTSIQTTAQLPVSYWRPRWGSSWPFENIPFPTLDRTTCQVWRFCIKWYYRELTKISGAMRTILEPGHCRTQQNFHSLV